MPSIPNVSKNDKCSKLVDMFNDLKNSQNKIITSINLSRKYIKL